MRLYHVISFLIVTGLLFSCSKSNKSTPSPASAAYDFKIYGDLKTGRNVIFSCTQKVTKEYWDFGDGTTLIWTDGSYNLPVGHTYKTAGNFMVSLIVDDDTAHAVRKKIQVAFDYYFVDSGLLMTNSPISFYFTGPLPAGNTYYWDFGDGNNSTDSAPVHTFSTSGTFTVRLKVNDSVNISQQLTISRDPLYTSLITTPRHWTGTVKYYYETATTTGTRTDNITDSTFSLTYRDPLTIEGNFVYSQEQSTAEHLYFVREPANGRNDYIYYDHQRDSISIHVENYMAGMGTKSVQDYDLHTH